MTQQKFTIEYIIHNEYANKRHMHARKTHTRIYFIENILLLELKNDPDLNTKEIFKNLYIHALSESFITRYQGYNEKTIKITAYQILFSNYA